MNLKNDTSGKTQEKAAETDPQEKNKKGARLRARLREDGAVHGKKEDQSMKKNDKQWPSFPFYT